MLQSSLVMKYDMVVMVSATADIAEVEKKLKDLVIKDGFTVTDIAQWGKRVLAYPIRKQHEANFLEFHLEANGKNPQLVGKALKLDDSILRMLVLKKEEKRKKRTQNTELKSQAN